MRGGGGRGVEEINVTGCTLQDSILFLSFTNFFLKGWGSNPRPRVTLSDPSALSSSEGAVTQESGRPAQVGT